MPADADRTNHAAEARKWLNRSEDARLVEQQRNAVQTAIAHALLAIHDRLTRGIETLR